MSELQKRIQVAGLPPRMPTRPTKNMLPPHKRRDYTPLSWDSYFDEKLLLETDRGKFCVYKKGSEGPLVIALHGGGFSALTWALFSKHLIESAVCQVLAFDQRGHGETVTGDDLDLSIETLAADVGTVVREYFGDIEPPPIILLGHSMGGAVAVHASESNEVPTQIGLIVIDVVEGTAMEALNGMKAFLRGRPPMFKSLEHAIEWSVRSGQIKNSESARVSMIGQVKPCSSSSSGTTAAPRSLPSDSISEEESGEETQTKVSKPDSSKDPKSQPSASASSTPHTWRIDLEKTEIFWKGWFEGLSSLFLNIPMPKVLLLAGIDRLDKELSIGQMQGKFQMQVIGHVGHAVHEDAPDKVADVVATYMVRNRFTEEGESFHSQADYQRRVGAMR